MSIVDRLRRLLAGDGSHETHRVDGGGECTTCRPISCLEAIERVHEYLDGELEEAAAGDVAHHFRVCQRCYPHLRLEERFRAALREAQGKEVCPDHLKTRVMEILAVEAGKEG